VRKYLLTCLFTLVAASAYAQKGVSFTASTDHNNTSVLTGYKVRITQGSTVVHEKDIAKPTPDGTNTITYLDASLFSDLVAGSYSVLAIAYGPGGSSSSAPTTFTVNPPPQPPAPPGPPTPIPNDPPGGSNLEIVRYMANAQMFGRWSVVADATAANGATAFNQDGLPKATAIANPPQNYVDVTFDVKAGVPYHVWMRMRALNNSYSNDSVYVQFSNAQDATGNPLARIGSSSAQVFILEEGSGAGEQGWGWNDANYGGLAAQVYFAVDGPQTMRIHYREDGIYIDQLVVSANTYLTARPGTTKNDKTIVAGGQ
jgi:hypothetical protein